MSLQPMDIDVDTSTPESNAVNAFYEIDNEKVTILGSDGDEGVLPECYRKDLPNGMIDILEYADGKQVREWKMKIGTLLAQELGVVLRGSGRHFILTEFPSGYKLYVRKKGTKANPRQDNYLYGSRYTKNFRSPNEFILHAHWLCIGAPLYPSPVNKPLCQCKYCTGNEKALIEDGNGDDDVVKGRKAKNANTSKKKRSSSSLSKSMSKAKLSILGAPLSSSSSPKKKVSNANANSNGIGKKAKAKESILKRKEMFSQSEVSRLLMGKKALNPVHGLNRGDFDNAELKEKERMKKEEASEAAKETVVREYGGVGGAIWTVRK